MKKLVFILVVLLFATATFAVAADQNVVAKGPVQMTDAEMAQVVGGSKTPPIGSGYYLFMATSELHRLTETLPLSKEQRSLIHEKISCIESLFRGINKPVKRPPPGQI